MLKCMKDPNYIKSMESMGLQVDTTSGDAYADLLNSQLETRKEIWGGKVTPPFFHSLFEKVEMNS